jgi:hypothetical protein
LVNRGVRYCERLIAYGRSRKRTQFPKSVRRQQYEDRLVVRALTSRRLTNASESSAA